MAKATKRGLPDEYLQIIRDMDGDLAGRAAADDHLYGSYEHDSEGDIAWATNPLTLNAEQFAALNQAASTIGSIMEKVMRKYQRDRTFRKLFLLTPQVEELTLVPSGCHAAVPLSRVDLFFDSETLDYQVCGIVTGGVDGMAVNAELNRALGQTKSYQEFIARHPFTHAIDAAHACVLSLMHTYGKWANAEEGRNHPTHPSVAVVDVENSRRAAESRTIIMHMRDMGIYARATHFSQLRIEKLGGINQLVDNHGPVTCVWLRATADEVDEQMGDGVRALLDATRHGMVCTVGGYRSWPCCTRAFLAVLHTKECQQLLSRDERAFIKAHIPQPTILEPSIDLSQFFDQENWVMRVADGHSSEDLVSGADMSKADWRKLLVKSIKFHDAVQSCLKHQTITVAGVDEQGEPFERPMGIMLGLFVFEGKLCGVRATCGTGKTIANWHDRLEMGSVIVDE